MQRFPALFWALFFLLGCSVFLYPNWALIIPGIALVGQCEKRILGLMIFTVGFLYAWSFCPKVEELSGRGIFCLEEIKPGSSPFGNSYVLKGKLMEFGGHSRLPCVMMQKRVPKGAKWVVQGRLTDGFFKGQLVEEVEAGFSMARARFSWKEKVRKCFHRRYPGKVGHFFASIATGDADDRLLAMEFRKVGLGHVLAISGFHFALFAGLLGFVLKGFLPRAFAYGALLVCLSGYFLFLGFSPSVLRAFIMIGLFILGKLLKRASDPCHLLGIAMLIELLIDPRMAGHVGFQLSFLATFGILQFYRPVLGLVERWLPEREFHLVQHLGLLDRHGYLLASWIRKGLALNFAVHMVTIPVSLFVFGSFPFLSLVYNLLFPPFLAFSMSLIPIGVAVPTVGKLNGLFAGWLLEVIGSPPELVHFQIFSHGLKFWMVIGWVTLIGAWGLRKTEGTDMIGGSFYGGRSSVG